jgi:ribosomal protein S3AE
MELEIRVSYLGATNKSQKQSYTQAIKQEFKHILKQTSAGNGI